MAAQVAGQHETSHPGRRIPVSPKLAHSGDATFRAPAEDRFRIQPQSAVPSCPDRTSAEIDTTRRPGDFQPVPRWLCRHLATAAVRSLGALIPFTPSRAWTIVVMAVTTDLSSDNERVISYRHQQHLTQTSDGALHLLMNRGTA